jgi:hypothetical protein
VDWMRCLNSDPIPWLLEEDHNNPGIRYFALRELLDLPEEDGNVVFARKAIMEYGPIPVILDAQSAEGYWSEPGAGYNPKYRSTVWTVTMLAQLGADGRDPRVKKGCEYVLDHARSTYGGFSAGLSPSGMIHCLQGNLGAALLDLGWIDDGRLQTALDWMARSVTGSGIAPAEEKGQPIRYYLSGNCAPGFCCSANSKRPCAWGAVKILLALSKIPKEKRSPEIKSAIQAGVDFLLSKDPAVADYPTPFDTKPNQSWFKFGYPIFYVTDILQNLEALGIAGYGGDERVLPALEFILDLQDEQGRWKMEYTYNGKTLVNIEEKHQESKWVTLRALRVLKRADQAQASS